MWDRYDENGGLYDHVPPPSEGVPNPDGINSTLPGYEFNFTRLGLRVPFVVVSPWVAKGAVFHSPQRSHYDHTSVLKTARILLDMSVRKPLTKREAWAASFEHFFNLTEPRTDCLETLPVPPQAQALWKKHLLARATPDEPETWARLTGTSNGKPLSDLQVDVCVTASHVAPGPRPTREEIATWTQDQAGMYVRTQWRKRKAMKV